MPTCVYSSLTHKPFNRRGDPLLRDLVSTVVSSTVAQTAPTSNASKRIKKNTPSIAQDTLLEVILHDTVLFPEGGGQPNDIGILTSADGNIWDVIDVKRRGGHAVHFVKVKDGNVAAALKIFTPGSLVRAALGEQGFQRRLDHMSMHTCQHLLSAVLETKLNLPTLAWSMTTYPTPSYVEVPRALTPEEISIIQAEANRLVFEGRQVHIEVEELDHSNRAYDTPSVGIPSDYTGGVKRTVIIDGVDRNPCCGTHLPSISNLQLFLIPQMEGLSRSSTSSARLYFLSGPRLITYFSSIHTLLTTTSNVLSCGAPLVPERVEQVIDERKKVSKRVEDLEAELASSIARDILKQAEDDTVVLHQHRTDDASNPLGFLSAISTAFVNEVSSAETGPSSYLIVLTSSPSMQTATSTTIVMTFGNDEKKVKEAGDTIRANVGVKGGGKGTKWSGKFTGVWKDTKEGKAVAGILKDISL
ncbi:unnamed protein product [Somion occarium]|uniref:Alanyl-tRNA synthetase class IIc N-terminal domain-containing protein n=1 Tax=Somion occarium TaxID=3059160 RepID=A0ABP1CZK4_9APHY